MRSRGLRVLLAGSSGYLEQSLRGFGHEVDAGPDQESALASARTHSLDVVILDQECGTGDLLEQARAIRGAAFWRKPMFIALTGSMDSCSESCYREAGIDLLLTKPVQPSLLLGFLGRLQTVVDDYESFDPVI